MILPLLKKRPITRSSIRGTTRCDRRRRRLPVVCGLLVASLLLAVVESEASKPRRRSTSLDRLKRRSATERWDELRHAWLPTTALDTPAGPEGTHHPGTADAAPPESAHGLHSAAIPAAEVQARTADSADMSPSRPLLLDPRSGDGARPWIATTPTGVEVQVPSPHSALPAAEPPPEIGASDSAPELPPQVSPAPYGLPRTPGETNGAARTASARDVLPKPITSILPYYDYSPDGEDPCEFLCPRPEGCPPDSEAKPCPEVVKLPDIAPTGREFLPTHVMWEPSNLFHNPLYFEDHALERYGHTHGLLLQPLVSAGKFGVQLIGMPYQLALHPPCEHQYTLGWHRPGECVPYRYHLPPWNTKAAITAGAAYTGLIFLIP